MNKFFRLFLLILTLLGIVSSITYLESTKTAVTSQESPASVGSAYRELQNPSAFLNTEPFKLADFVGKKVILIDFWTYSCINCQRTTPYLNAWHEAYADDGLLIVGIHTPEFEFEKELSNVEAAVQAEGISYPVVLDNDKATWNTYGNRYWPRKYLIDLSGNIVYDLIGEGSYAQTEIAIRSALSFTNEAMSTPKNVVETDFSKVTSPETYFGSERAENLELLSIEPFSLNPDVGYLIGNWQEQAEYAQNADDDNSILYLYNAKNVYMVAAVDPSVNETVEVEVWLDGQFLKTITVSNETLYPVIEGSNYGSHILKLIPKAPGLQLFTFTFG